MLSPYQYGSRFNYTAAERLARDNNLVVVSYCSANLPPGIPPKDGLGNYIKAESVYIGSPGAASINCANALLFATIHQTCTPSAASALRCIGESMATLEAYPTFDSYLEVCRSYSPGWIDYNNRLTEARDQYERAVATVARAKRTLPQTVIDAIPNLVTGGNA